MTSSSRHVLVLVPLLFGSCVQFHLAATCARGAVVRIWLDLQRKTGLIRAVVYRLSISQALIRAPATEISLRAISKFWSTGAAEYCISLCPKMRYAFPRSPRVLISCFSISCFKMLGVRRRSGRGAFALCFFSSPCATTTTSLSSRSSSRRRGGTVAASWRGDGHRLALMCSSWAVVGFNCELEKPKNRLPNC